MNLLGYVCSSLIAMVATVLYWYTGVAGSSGQSGLAVLQVLAPRSGSGASSSSKATFFEAPDAPSFQQLFTVPSVPSTNPSQVGVVSAFLLIWPLYFRNAFVFFLFLSPTILLVNFISL
jgi:hypothetical protein